MNIKSIRKYAVILPLSIAAVIMSGLVPPLVACSSVFDTEAGGTSGIGPWMFECQAAGVHLKHVIGDLDSEANKDNPFGTIKMPPSVSRQTPAPYAWVEVHAGIPFKHAYGYIVYKTRDPSKDRDYVGTFLHGFRRPNNEFPGLQSADHIVPYGVNVLFFLLNLLIWSLLFWLLMSFIQYAIIRRRCKKSLCPSCKYPTHSGATQCPECGGPYPKKLKESIADSTAAPS